MRWVERLLIFRLMSIFLSVSCLSCITQIKRVLIMPPGTEIHRQYRESVVRLTLQPGELGYDNNYASGFAISKDYLLTAGHFCTGLQENIKKKMNSKLILIEAADRDGVAYEAGYATISNNHSTHDMCILKSEGHSLLPLPLLGDMSIIETEDPVTVLGSPRNYFPVRRDGYIISKQAQHGIHVEPRQLLFIAINIEPGSSGSPVIWNGQVIGIVIRYLYDSTLKEAALATRGDHIIEFVDKYIDRSK